MSEAARPLRSVWTVEIRMPRPARVDAAAALGLAGLVMFLFREAVFRGRIFFERDLHFDWYARVASFIRSLALGSLPLWDNSIAFGQPLLADPSAQILYPFTWLHLALLPWTYYTVYVVAHLWLSAMGLYLLAKRLGVSPAGAFVAAAVWTTSGPTLSLVNLWHHFSGAAWIPWVFLAAHAGLEAPGLRRTLLFGAAMGGQILTGSADMCALTGLVVAAYGLTRMDWRRPWAPANRRIVLLALVAAAFALALSAGLWASALDVARRSARWGLPEQMRTAWSVHPLSLLQTLLPLFLDLLPLRSVIRAELYESREPFLASLYLGMPALALVGAAWVPRERRLRGFFLGVGVIAALVALGRFSVVYDLGISVLPPLKILRYPSKAMILPAFCWALVAGMGFDAWRRGGDDGAHRWLLRVGVPLAVAAGAGVVVAGLGRLEADVWGPRLLSPLEGQGLSFHDYLSPITRPVLVASLLSAAALILVRLRSRRREGSLGLAAAMAVLALLDLASTHRLLNPTAPRELLQYRSPVLDAVRLESHRRLYLYDYYYVRGKSERYLGRENPYPVKILKDEPAWLVKVLAQRMYFYPSVAGLWGIEGSYDIDLRGLYARPLADMTRFIRHVEGARTHTRLLRLGAVSTMVGLHGEGLEDLIPEATLPSRFPEPIRVFRVPDPLPRSYAVSGVRVADRGLAFKALEDEGFDPAHFVILPGGRPRPMTPLFWGESRITELRPDRVRLEAELSHPGYVVLVDTYDPGWKATLDGGPAPVLRANVCFRAVEVPAGRHAIELVYRPRSVFAGLAVSATALLAGLAVGLAGARKSPATRGAP